MVCAQWCFIIPFPLVCSTKTYAWSVPNDAVWYLPSLLLNQDLCMICAQWCCMIPSLTPAQPRLMNGLCPMMQYDTFPLSCSTKTYAWSVPNDAVWYLPSLLLNQDLCMVCAQWCCIIPPLFPAQLRLMHGLWILMLYDTFPLSCSTKTYAWSVPNDAVSYLPSLLLNQDLFMVCAQWCCTIPFLSPALPRLMHGLCPMMLYDTFPLSCSTKTYAWSVPNGGVWYLSSLLLNQDLCMICAQWCCIIFSLSPAQPRLMHGLCPMMLYDTFPLSCSTKTYAWSLPNDAVRYLSSLLLYQELCMVCAQCCCTIPFLSPALPRLMHDLCPMMLYDTFPLSWSTKTYAWSVPNDAVWYLPSLLLNQDLSMICAQWCCIIPFLSPDQPRLMHDLCPMMLYDTFPLSCSTKTYAWSVPNDAVWYLPSLLLNQDLWVICAQWCCMIPSLSPAQPRLMHNLCPMMLYDTFHLSCSTKTYQWSVPNDAVWYLSSLLINQDLCMICAQWCCMIPSLSPAQPRLMHGLCPLMLYATFPLSCSNKTYAWSVPNDAVWYLSSLLLNREKDHLAQRSVGVIECLTRDWRAASLGLTGVTVLCSWACHINPCLVMVQPRKTRLGITERLLTEKTRTKNKQAQCSLTK